MRHVHASRQPTTVTDFVLVGADVALLARGSEALASRFVGVADPGRAGYLLHPVRPGSGVSST